MFFSFWGWADPRFCSLFLEAALYPLLSQIPYVSVSFSRGKGLYVEHEVSVAETDRVTNPGGFFLFPSSLTSILPLSPLAVHYPLSSLYSIL